MITTAKTRSRDRITFPKRSAGSNSTIHPSAASSVRSGSGSIIGRSCAAKGVDNVRVPAPPPGIATGVLSVLLGRVVSGPRRVVIRAVHPSRRALGAHRRMTGNARGRRLSIVRVLSVLLRREQKLGRQEDGRSASTAIPLRHAQSALKGHANALMTADVKMTVNVRNRRRSIVRVRPVILARERTLPKGDGR